MGRINFYGVPCYDLIHYVSRTLYHLDVGNILLLDLSKDQSLAYSIPYTEDNVVDYRGISFASSFDTDMLLDYDVILAYIGVNINAINEYPELQHSDLTFIVSDCQLHNIAAINDILGVLEFSEEPNGLQDGFASDRANLIILDYGATSREKFIAHELNLPISDTTAIELDELNTEYRYLCQYDVNFKFKRISPDYKELIKNICMSLMGDIPNKTYNKASKLAQGGQ